MTQNKIFYLIVLILIAGFIIIKVTDEGSKEYSEVLPEAGYCININHSISYTTQSINGEIIPIEYCKLKDFCQVFEVSSVLNTQQFDNKKLDEVANLWVNYDCFQDEAKHSQQYFNGTLSSGEYVKSKFVCCNPKKDNKINCEPNICKGRVTGAKDVNGCELYAVELCNAKTECQYILNNIVCNPTPPNGQCTWKTKEELGNTYFSYLNNCHDLKVEDVCGTAIHYGCEEADNKTCILKYEVPTKKYIQNCGGTI